MWTLDKFENYLKIFNILLYTKSIDQLSFHLQNIDKTIYWIIIINIMQI